MKKGYPKLLLVSSIDIHGDVEGKNVLLNIKSKKPALHMNTQALTKSRCEFNGRGKKSANAC